MNPEKLLESIIDSIGNAKGLNIAVLDVRRSTDITDYFVIVTGSSNRHVKSISRTVIDELRDRGVRPLGVEGEQYSHWILLDFCDVLVNVMLAETREFYDLESLWDVTLNDTAVTADSPTE